MFAKFPVKRLFAGVFPCLLFLLCASAICGEEFSQSFGGRPYDKTAFRPIGNTWGTMGVDPQGLRISLAATHGSKIPVGLIHRMEVRGDFEITMAFELVRVDKPTTGTG